MEDVNKKGGEAELHRLQKIKLFKLDIDAISTRLRA